MKYVLFVCTHNAGRSQMAHAFFDRHTPLDLRAESAGTQPAREVWPTVVEAMAEYDDVPVRSYTTILATRKARECLREETCDALVAG